MGGGMKVVFLDIDGVLQPRTNKRGEHRKEIPAFCRMMDKRMKGLYHYEGWLGESGFDLMDVGAVRYDWDVTAVETLRRLLDKSKAKIVLSSDWKDMRAMRLMKALLAIHDLDGYLWDRTISSDYLWLSHEFPFEVGEKYRKDYITEISKVEDAIAKSHGLKNRIEMDQRVAEILEFLDRHPEIVSYVAVDDRNLVPGLEGHFIQTWPALTLGDGRKMLKCLAVEDGPYRLPQGCHTNGLKRIRSDYLPIIDRLWRKEPALHVPS